MPLEPAADLLAHARRHGYAVGYFESWDIASLEGVIDAAEQRRAPVIVGFNGEFLARWDANNGVAMEVWGKDPDSAVVRFICESLELSVTRNLINGTNFGF